MFCSGVPPFLQPLGPVDFNDILDDPSADGAAGVELLLQLKTAGVAEAHVSAGVDHRVHLAVEAHGALPVLAARWLRGGEDRRDGGAQRGAGGSHCGREIGDEVVEAQGGGKCS